MAMVLDAFASYVQNMLTEMVTEEMHMLLGVTDEIDKMDVKLRDLKNFLADADRRNITDKSVQEWVGQLKRAMYEAADILDLCQLKAMEQGPSTKDVGCFNPLLFCMRNPSHAHDIGTRIKALNKRLDTIKERSAAFSFINLGSYDDRSSKVQASHSGNKRRETSGVFDRSGVVGEKIEEDTRKLVEIMLTEKEGSTNIMVVAIVDVGGIGGFHLMSCLKDVPTLKGDNYTEWRKKVDLAFICAEVDWVVDEPQPVRPTEPVRESTDNDAAWDKKKRDYAPIEMAYTLENQKWINANKKCMAFIKNTIENAIVGSIAECTSVGELLTKIKSQFTGSSKTYATQLIKQLVTTDYTGGGTGIREHILRMSNMASKLKPMDADLEIKPALLVHLVMASLPKHFDTFVVNYNMSPEKWDIEKTIAMCVQEEDRLKASNGGSLNYVKGKQKKYSQSDKGSPSKPYGKASYQHQQKSFSVDKDTCIHCKKMGHYKKDCLDWLKSLMAKKGIPFDENYAKKRKMH